MQRLLFTSSICLCAYIFASVALAAEVFESSKVAPSNSLEYEPMEKTMLDYSPMNSRDVSEERQQQSSRAIEPKEASYSNDNLPRNFPIKWYLVRGALPASFKWSPEQVTNHVSSVLPFMSFNRQLAKKQTHKKNPRSNPRDILRGLAVKRDHFY